MFLAGAGRHRRPARRGRQPLRRDCCTGAGGRRRDAKPRGSCRALAEPDVRRHRRRRNHSAQMWTTRSSDFTKPSQWGAVGTARRTCIVAERPAIVRMPSQAHVSMSFVERHTLNLRRNMHWFRWLANALSKKIENLHVAVSLDSCALQLWASASDLTRHADVSDRLWSLDEIVKRTRHLGSYLWLPFSLISNPLRRMFAAQLGVVGSCRRGTARTRMAYNPPLIAPALKKSSGTSDRIQADLEQLSKKAKREDGQFARMPPKLPFKQIRTLFTIEGSASRRDLIFKFEFSARRCLVSCRAGEGHW